MDSLHYNLSKHQKIGQISNVASDTALWWWRLVHFIHFVEDK